MTAGGGCRYLTMRRTEMKDGNQKNISPRLRIAIAVSAAAALILITEIISLFAGREGTSAPDSQIGTGGVSQIDSSADSADYADITRGSPDGSKTPAPSGDSSDTSDSTKTPDSGENGGNGDDAPALSVDLGDGIVLTGITSVDGAFVEDGSDDKLEGVLAVTVKNTAERTLQYGTLTLPGADGAQFTVTTLAPGRTALLLEASRAKYTDGIAADGAHMTQSAFFTTEPTLNPDRIELSCTDGEIHIKNVSGERLDATVVLYYKNVRGDMFYGGITYRVSADVGIDAGKSVSVSAPHCTSGATEAVFAGIG